MGMKKVLSKIFVGIKNYKNEELMGINSYKMMAMNNKNIRQVVLDEMQYQDCSNVK